MVEHGQMRQENERSGFKQTLAFVQAVYFLITGIWPLVSIGTFQKITGPKQDLWLVKTVGVLVAVIGVVLGLAGVRRRITAGERLLALGSAAGLAAIDVIYVLRRRIRPIYLLDAALELLLIAGWLFDQTRAVQEPLAGAGLEPAGSQPVGESYYISAFEPAAD